MGCEVYANGDEIACKAGDGKVIAAFPDVCLSPPSPPAGPVPVPYPDTSFSKDMQNGSKTVMIKNQEVMLKDSSFYKTSPLGDEAATNGLGAGVVTHVITGKTYFIAWSMDVQFEGQNVDRHTDLTTSNHASPPGNSAPQINQATAAAGGQGTTKCNHEYECTPKPQKPGTTDQKMAELENNPKKTGDPFEARCLKHNRADIADNGNDVNADFKCKKCGDVREVDHVTRDKSGNITKVVQCKSDQGSATGGKGVNVDPKQLREGRKIIQAINECQKNSGVQAQLEYKLQDTSAGAEAKKFLLKKDPPLITMVA